MTSSSLSPVQLGQLLLNAVERSPSPAMTDEITQHIEMGAVVDYQDDTGWTPLMVAVSYGYMEAAKLLIENGADVNYHKVNQQVDRWTPLIRAVDAGRVDMAAMLIEKGADIEHRDGDGWTALFWAASNNRGNPREDVLSIAKMLIEKGAKVHRRDKTGSTPLIYAVEHSDISMARLLIEHSKSGKFDIVNAANKADWTPLHFACKNANTEIVELLLDSGADASVKNRLGTTPLIAAATSNSLACVEKLLKFEVDINHQANDGWTALFSSAKEGNTKITKLLLNNGADPNLTNNFGWTPILYSSAYGNLETTKMLVENGAELNKTDQSGWSALMHTARKGFGDIGHLLLDKGADLTLSSTSKCYYARQIENSGNNQRCSSAVTPVSCCFGVGSTSLMIAATETRLNFVSMVTSWLSNGNAELKQNILSQTNSDGKTASDMVDSSQSEVEAKLKQLLSV